MFLSSISLQERPKTSFTQGPIRNESVKHLPYQLINKDKVTTVVSSFDGLPFTTSEHVTQKRATAQHIYGSTQEDEEIIVDYEPSHEARGRAFISTLSQEKQDQGWPQTPIKNIQQDMCHQTELTNTKKICKNCRDYKSGTFRGPLWLWAHSNKHKNTWEVKEVQSRLSVAERPASLCQTNPIS